MYSVVELERVADRDNNPGKIELIRIGNYC